MNNLETSKDSSGKDFISSGIVWSMIFLLMPIFIWLGTNDWIITLSSCAKIGIGLIILGFILLSLGAGHLTGQSESGAQLYSPGESERMPRAIQSFLTQQALSAISYAKIWITLWGLIYVIPLAFGVPFLLN